ncbi:MAG: DUF58 domain-containing protein [Chloroflexota bacterium]|nr:DUF58 domain-containing protein [Chloroflexota bacterium]
MRVFSRWLFLCRAYVIAALVAAGVFSPLAYAAIPWLALLAYLYLESKGGQATLKVPLYVFLALSLPLFFKPLVGAAASPAFILPMIPLLDQGLRQSALIHDLTPAGGGRRPTRLCLSLALSLVVVGLVSVALTSWGLLFSCGILASYLAAVLCIVLRRLSKTPIEAEVVSYRLVAGDHTQTPVRLLNRSGLAGQLSLISSYSWFHIRPSRLVLDRPSLEVEASFAPPLAGPATVTVQASFLDPWGLMLVDFKLEAMRLFVIPRARYAEWLARRYLEVSRPGVQEAMTTAAPTSQRPSRKGMEFYGLRSYQPGDSAKIIDWKHTLKLHQLIVKEFLDTGVERAVLAVNLSVIDEEEKDKLVYSLINTALTLARENIPSVLAAYNHQGVVATTRLLDPQRALLRALGLAREVQVSLNPLRYLGVPDVRRLRGNIYRLTQSEPEPARRLGALLQLEYLALSNAARQNPASQALDAALGAVKGRVNVLLLSGCNHDVEAIAFNEHSLRERGYRVLLVGLEREGRGRLFEAMSSMTQRPSPTDTGAN